ncbi:MAG: hypothetical protein ACREGF_06800, partial [Candidatus Saccharimonadales bacterium]
MKNKKVKPNQPVALFRLRAVPVVALTAGCLMLGALAAPMAGADSLQDQINSLSAQNSQVRSSVNTLSLSATNYQDAIKQLQSQIGSMQAAIVASQAEQAKLNTQIQVYQTKLDQQKQILGSDIKSMYVNGQITTIEELASSKNLSTFVDAQTYRNAVQNEVQNTLTQISQLQATLNDQEKQVAQLLNSQQLQEQQLAADQQQQTQLLALNQQQQASYNQTLQTNNVQISKLNQEIAAINRSNSVKTLASGGACDAADGDTYPVSLCGAPKDYLTDQWGLLNRECVSYTAWMEASQGKYVPYGLGNAGDWPDRIAERVSSRNLLHARDPVHGGIGAKGVCFLRGPR